MSLGEVEQILAETDHNGFPVIVSTESQYLVGFVLRRDLNLAIKAARSRFDAIPADTIVYFSSHGDGGGGVSQVSNSPLRFTRQFFWRNNIFLTQLQSVDILFVIMNKSRINANVSCPL